jgi:hypothetical protein
MGLSPRARMWKLQVRALSTSATGVVDALLNTISLEVGGGTFARQVSAALATVGGLTSLGSILPSALTTVANAQAVLAGVVAEQTNLATALGAVVAGAPSASVCSALLASNTASSAVLAASGRLGGAPFAAVDRVASAVGSVVSAFTTSAGDQFCVPCALATLEVLGREAATALSASNDAALVSVSAPVLTSLLDDTAVVTMATSTLRNNLALSNTVLTRAQATRTAVVSPDSLQLVLRALGSATQSMQDAGARADAVSGKVQTIGTAVSVATTFFRSIATSSAGSNGVALFQSTLQAFVGFGSAVSSVLNSPELVSFFTLVDSGAAAVFDTIIDGVRLLNSTLDTVDKGLTTVR